MAREPNRTSDILEAVALLVVDMQDAFLRVIPDAAAALDRCAFAIEAARAFGLKVVFTEQVPEKLGRTNPRLTALAPEARVFGKVAFSALQAEGLVDHLRKHGVYHLLVAGLETPVCVYQTALHAHDSDFDVTILSDCVTGRRIEDCGVALDALAHSDCHVLPSEAVFYSMLGTSLNPRFPAFTNLVKRYSGDATFEPTTPEPVAAFEPPSPDAGPFAPAAEQDVAAPIASGDPLPSPEAEEFSPASESADSDATGRTPDDGFADVTRDAGGAPAGSAEGEPRRKRSRRRRGGVRHRKARERAAAAEGQHPAQGQDSAARSDPAGAAPPDDSAGFADGGESRAPDEGPEEDAG